MSRWGPTSISLRKEPAERTITGCIVIMYATHGCFGCDAFGRFMGERHRWCSPAVFSPKGRRPDERRAECGPDCRAVRRSFALLRPRCQLVARLFGDVVDLRGRRGWPGTGGRRD